MKNSFYAIFTIFFTALTINASAAIQYKQFGKEGYFSIDSDQQVYIDVKKADGTQASIGDSVISNIGWYNYDEVYNYRDQISRLPGPGQGPSRPWPTPTAPKLHYGDVSSGTLGEFKAGDRIVLWVETTSSDGKKETFTMYTPDIPTSANSPASKDRDIWMLEKSGESIVFNWGDFTNQGAMPAAGSEGFQFAIATKPSGQPLPGIIATLLVGSGAVVYLKKRKKLYKSE